MRDARIVTGKADAALDQRLNDELAQFNGAATPGLAAALELTVKVEHDGELAGGVSGWTWGQAAGIVMTWVREDQRGTGLGSTLMASFESEAVDRGCTHIFVTSFTFQAPAFYQRLGFTQWPESGDEVVLVRSLPHESRPS